MAEYRILVETSTIDYGGTDANVYITLIGEQGSSGERHLAGDDELFEKGSMDLFRLSTNELGNLQRVRIRHDNTGDDDGWFLNRITIEHEGDHRLWVAPCYRWLADDEDDRQIDRTLNVITEVSSPREFRSARAAYATQAGRVPIEVH